jgi:hypothetical protein
VSLESYEAEGVITNGQLQPVSVVVFRQAMREFADGRVVIRIETEEVAALSKTRLQEKGFHAMIAPWAKAEGLSIDDLKHDLLREVFSLKEHVDRFTGEVSMVLREPHTSKLSRKDYSELIERTLQIAAECGHELVAPNEYREWKARQRRSA